MSKIKEDEILSRLKVVIKIFFAKEISSGPIKEEISRRVLIEWLQGINQAATAVEDHYVMKATMQLIGMVADPAGADEIFVDKKARELMDLFRRWKEEHDELPLHTARNIVRYMQKPEIRKGWLPTAENINALPEPVRNYIADMQTNADPPSMVADNIILRDTIKTLEKMLEELPETTEAWAGAKAKQIRVLIEDARDEDLDDPVTSLHYLGLSLDIVTSIINDLRPKK